VGNAELAVQSQLEHFSYEAGQWGGLSDNEQSSQRGPEFLSCGQPQLYMEQFLLPDRYTRPEESAVH